LTEENTVKNFLMPFRTGIVVLVLIGLLFGCSKLTQENYDRLQAGMSYGDVADILGPPDDCVQTLGVKSCTWGDEHKNIKATFMGDAAIVFSATGIK
jgi:hypothetical protein